MKKITTKIRFVDSNSKEFIRRKLKDTCEKVITDYNENPTTISPIIKIGSYGNGEWDTSHKEGMKNFKQANLNKYANEEGVLDFDKLLKEFYDFLTIKNNNKESTDLLDANELDELEETEEEIDESEVDEDEVDEVLEGLEEEKTYQEYFKEKANLIEKKNFRYYLLNIVLGEAKGWSYIKTPNSVNGDEYDVVTPKNAKKIAKRFSETNK